jgi:hypothetical protein
LCGISAAPSIATISAPAGGSARCNNAGSAAADESALRSLSTDTVAAAAAGAGSFVVQPLDFRLGL